MLIETLMPLLPYEPVEYLKVIEGVSFGHRLYRLHNWALPKGSDSLAIGHKLAVTMPSDHSQSCSDSAV